MECVIVTVIMIVCNQRFDKATISRIQTLSDSNPEISLSELARRVCEMLNWRRPNGDFKEGSSRRALHRLKEEGHLDLPEPQQQWAFQNPNPPAETLPEGCTEFEGTLDQLGEVRLELIPTTDHAAYMTWRDMMDVAHPLGRGPLAGGRLRYLITSSERGILGALAFSSAAYHLRSRARFIGWTPEAREHNRERIVQNSRFLILPEVKVPNLASHVLGKAARQVPGHWREKYGYEAVMLETFVNRAHHDGSCYRAAGWEEVGLTTGRGRGREDEQKTPKRVFLRPLHPQWQRELCRRPDGTVQVLEPEGEPSDWAERELGSIQLGDKRLDRRAAEILRQFYGKPLCPIPAACCGEANVKAAYRFFSNSRTSMDKILQPHYERTLERASEQDEVLAVQDSSSLNYKGLESNEYIGRINNCDKDAVGLHLHDTMLFNSSGVPLGLLDVQMWTRDWEARDKNRIKEVPIEEKESFKWLKSYGAACEAQRQHPETRFISIGDREADVYDLFVMARDTEGAAGLLVRCAKSRRRRTTEGKLWEVMAGKPVEAQMNVHVPARRNRPERDAVVEVRRSEVELLPPKRKEQMGTVQMWAVYVVEKDPEGGSDRLEWMLLTTEPTETTDDATGRVEQYGGRWGVERYHKCLKSGCRMEDRQLQTGEGLQTCLAMDMIVAFRIYRLTMLGREVPDMPCEVYFSDCEWKALVTYVEKDPKAAEGPQPTLQEAVEMVALLGGYRKRKSPPGDQTMWRGIQRLADMAEYRRILHGNENTPEPPGPL
mgnify:CR=1 FL=1